MGAPHIITDGCMIVGHDGTIVACDTTAAVTADAAFKDATYERDVDVEGQDVSIIPGFCDAHTHPVWAGDRCNEFAMKLAGATYMEVHAKGGGIGFTVKHTRAASETVLRDLLHDRMTRMLRYGTTLMEGKSGYGLDLDTEVKQMRVMQLMSGAAQDAACDDGKRAAKKAKTAASDTAAGYRPHDVEVVVNYCGAHSVPKPETAAEATRRIVDVDLPAIVKLTKEGYIKPEMIDVFCEKGVFEHDDTETILRAGIAQAGLDVNFHGDELSYTASAELGAKLNARAISHLEHVSDAGVTAMAASKTAAVLLPTTAYVLRIEPPPARKLIDSDVVVALGSDFNPNAHCLSMPHVLNLACVTMKMTMEEALVAATLNAAYSMCREKTHGSLAVGKQADFVMIGHKDWRHIVYEQIDPPIAAVYKRGRLVWESSTQQK